jgi:hypothetical protein
MSGTVSDALDATNTALVILFVFPINIHSLKPASEFLIRSLLASTLVDFVVSWWARSAKSARSFWPVRSTLHILWHLHMVKSVRFDRFVVEPRTVARLPLEATYHAKLCCAATMNSQ